MTVTKRDGREVPYTERAIYKAVTAASKAAKENLAETDIQKVVSFVETNLKTEKTSVEEIQRLVENGLMNNNFYDTARCYVEYRSKRDRERYERLEVTKNIRKKLDGKNNECQNANIDELSFGGRKGEGESVLNKQMALDYYISPRFAKNHKDNLVYIHDLSDYVIGDHNCLSIPFDDLLSKGFSVKNSDCRPAGSIFSGLQLVGVLIQTQSLQQFGGVSATHLDFTMEPYVRKSFFKHYVAAYIKSTKDFYRSNLLDLMFEDYTDSFGVIRNRFDDWLSENKQIFLKRLGLTFEDFYIGNPRLDKKFYQQALYDTIVETKQAAEGLLHNLNTLLSRSGNQLPFSSINFGKNTSPEGRLVTQAIYQAANAGIGKYGRTSIFPCQIFQYSRSENGEEGTPNYDLYLKAIALTSRRLYPNYVNTEWSVQLEGIRKDRVLKKRVIERLPDTKRLAVFNLLSKDREIAYKLGLSIEGNRIVPVEVATPLEDFSTMGCRTNNSYNVNFSEEYFEELLDKTLEQGSLPLNYLYSAMQRDGRGNICPATVILPFVAMKALKKMKKEESVVKVFMSLLEKYIEDAKDELLERFEWICSQSPASASFMYQNNTMKGYKPEEGIRSALKHGTLAIGQLGLAECLQILVDCDHTEKRGMEVAIAIETLFKRKCDEYKEKYSLNFGVYYTPAENLCYTAMTAFQKKYGLIENVSAFKDENGQLVGRPYFTNSMHVPVWKEISPFEKIDIESRLTSFSSAGCITYVELNDKVKWNAVAVKQIVDYAMQKDIPYFAINVPVDTCLKCGYQGVIEGEVCPSCGAPEYRQVLESGKKKSVLTGFIERLRRITGYLVGSYKQNFNAGKKVESEDRKNHTDFFKD